METLMQIVWWVFIIIFVMYWIPTIVAVGRNAESKVGIFFLNLLLGWTFIVWVVCFVWAFVSPSENKKVKQVVNVQNQVNIACGNCSEIIKIGDLFCVKCGEKLQVTIIDNKPKIENDNSYRKDLEIDWNVALDKILKMFNVFYKNITDIGEALSYNQKGKENPFMKYFFYFYIIFLAILFIVGMVVWIIV